jgi:hypothetical protein
MNKFSKLFTFVMLFLSLALIKAQEPVAEKTEASPENIQKEENLRFLQVYSPIWGECDWRAPYLIQCEYQNCMSCIGGTCYPDCDKIPVHPECPKEIAQYCQFRN